MLLAVLLVKLTYHLFVTFHVKELVPTVTSIFLALTCNWEHLPMVSVSCFVGIWITGVLALEHSESGFVSASCYATYFFVINERKVKSRRRDIRTDATGREKFVLRI